MKRAWLTTYILAQRRAVCPNKLTGALHQQPVGRVIEMELAKAFNREKAVRRGVMRRLAILGWVLVLSFAVGFGASTASGQAVYGGITGSVTDPQGNAVAGAKVTVTNIS